MGGGGAELLVTVPRLLMGSQGCRHPAGAPSLHSKHGESIAGLQILEKSDKCTTQKAAMIPHGCFESPSRTFQGSLWKAKRREATARGSVPRWRAAGLLHEEQASCPARLGSAVIALISLAGIS